MLISAVMLPDSAESCACGMLQEKVQSPVTVRSLLWDVITCASCCKLVVGQTLLSGQQLYQCLTCDMLVCAAHVYSFLQAWYLHYNRADFILSDVERSFTGKLH